MTEQNVFAKYRNIMFILFPLLYDYSLRSDFLVLYFSYLNMILNESSS